MCSPFIRTQSYNLLLLLLLNHINMSRSLLKKLKGIFGVKKKITGVIEIFKSSIIFFTNPSYSFFFFTLKIFLAIV